MLVILLLAGRPAHAADEAWLHLTGEANVGYDSNVTNSARDVDVRDSAFAGLSLQGERTVWQTTQSRLDARLGVAGEQWREWDALDNVKLSAGLRLLDRPGVEFHAPTLWAQLLVSWWEFNSAMRDSNEARFSFAILQQVTTKLRGRLSVGASWRDADSRVFDVNNRHAALHVDWVAGPRLTIAGGYQMLQGDAVSTARPGFWIVQRAEAIEPDDAFGGLATAQFAYRLPVVSHVASLGATYVLSPNWSLDARVQHIDARAKGGIEYERWISVGSLLARF